MRKQDWAGSVLVAALLALAGYFHSHGAAVGALVAVCIVSVGVIGYDVGKERGLNAPDPKVSDRTDVVLTVNEPFCIAYYRAPNKKELRSPVLILSVRAYAAIPADAPKATLLDTWADVEVIGLQLTAQGSVGQYVEQGTPPPPKFTYPAEVEPGEALEIDCKLYVQLPWDYAGELPERPRKARAVVFVSDHLRRKAEMEVDFGFVLDEKP